VQAQEHPAVAESAAVSSPDKARGEIVKAFIQLHPEYQSKLKTPKDEADLIADIQAAFRKASAPYKVPRGKSLPRFPRDRTDPADPTV
jgi:acyl-coenzyme A synthetase/AMP-(fatty) acid ligase